MTLIDPNGGRPDLPLHQLEMAANIDRISQNVIRLSNAVETLTTVVMRVHDRVEELERKAGIRHG